MNTCYSTSSDAFTEFCIIFINLMFHTHIFFAHQVLTHFQIRFYGLICCGVHVQESGIEDTLKEGCVHAGILFHIESEPAFRIDQVLRESEEQIAYESLDFSQVDLLVCVSTAEFHVL